MVFTNFGKVDMWFELQASRGKHNWTDSAIASLITFLPPS
ncbi:hypothetical protein FM107_17895 [Sphingobacterium sp. JB170]|nr:hypothetical protein FM107_17895 [Sphingobacterium sp. JB170]